MMNKEEYRKELIRMLDNIRDDEYKGKGNCDGVNCVDCPLQEIKYGCSNALSSLEIYCAVEKWSKEHPPKKYKVSRLEYDILEIYVGRGFYGHFGEYGKLMALLIKGYFKGATSETYISDYFENCEIEVDE